MSDAVSDIKEETVVEDIKVCLRLRPLNKRERDPKMWGSSGEYAWKPFPQANSMIQVQRNGSPVGREDRKSGRSMFTFDKVFEDSDTTEYVYSFAGKELVQSCIEGRNGSIFAYGQTSSGKTHTMQGDGSIRDGMIKENRGIIHMVAKDLFQEADLVKDRDFVFNVSVIEVYNEEVRDLLSKAKDNRLGIREDTSLGVFVNATRVEASSLKKLIACLSAGERNRAVARTTLNKRSSRSHIIFSISIESFPVDDISGGGYGRISTLNLIDLAGSESVRHRSSHSNETRRKEGGSINKSLLTLSLVIQALGAPAKQKRNARGHINYRDSKLTRVLQPSLSGNARMAFICCATASGLYMEETKSTLQFASRIKHIKTKSKINIVDDVSTSSQAKEELNNLKRQIAEMAENMKKIAFENKKLKAQLEEMIEERDDAFERVVNLEKAKNVAVLAAVDAAAVASASQKQVAKRGSRFKKPPLPEASGDVRGVSVVNRRMSGQVGFLANVVDRLVSKKDEPNEYQRRQETPVDILDSDSTINGIRKNLRLDSSKTMISDITPLSRYGTHRSVSDGEDPPQLPLLGLAGIEVSVKNKKTKIPVSDDDDVPRGSETSGSEEEEELRFDLGFLDAPIEQYSA